MRASLPPMAARSAAVPSASRRPTIGDVAARAGVSKSLVSLALRGSDGVNDRTRERILAAARELGYRHNSMARALVQGQTGLVRVLVTDLANPYHTEVVAGIEGALDEGGTSTVIGHGRPDAARLAVRLEDMLRLRVDAVVVTSSWIGPDHPARGAAEASVVVVGRLEAPVPSVDSVANDDTVGTTLAVEHLAALGHRRIAHLAGSGRAPASRERERAYVGAMERLDLGDHVFVAHPPAGPDGLGNAARSLAATAAPPSWHGTTSVRPRWWTPRTMAAGSCRPTCWWWGTTTRCSLASCGRT